MAYTGFITRLQNVRQHSNADRLQVGECFGNNVIVSMEMTENQLVVYFPTDGKLGLEYATTNNLIRIKNEDGSQSGGYLDPEKRNITALKLRGEKSDGLVMSLESLSKYTDITKLKEGELIDVLGGVTICEKYIPNGKRQVAQGTGKVKSGKQKPQDKIVYPNFKEHINTAQLAYNRNAFKEGDLCTITLKIHGTSQRTAHTLKEHTKSASPLKHKFMKLFNINATKQSHEYVTGTRRVVLKSWDNVGYYNSNDFRKKWHDEYVGKLKKGESVYYEIAGYTDTGALIMSECSNELTKDKAFIKQWGKKTQFTYGCEPNQSDMWVYRMTFTDDNGTEIEYPWHMIKLRCQQMGVKYCPEFEQFFFTTWEDLNERVNKWVDGQDPIGQSHIREGVVVRIENREKFSAYKAKNFSFKCLEGIAKANAESPDMEEEQEITEEII
jgi:hypothetical protein